MKTNQIKTTLVLFVITFLFTITKSFSQVKLNINGGFQIGYHSYTPILIGPSSSYSAMDGKWGIEYWSDFGGLNFWIPSPNPGAGNNYLFLQDVTGNIGIGTPTPEYKLHVVGDIFAHGNFISSDNRLKRNITNVSQPQYRKLYQLVGKSYDKKEAIGPIPNYLNIQDSLKRLTTKYQSNNQSDKYAFEYGFIAQDFQSLFPELVKGDTSNSFLSINYTALIPLIIEALKDQQIQIDSLKQALTQCCENKSNKGNNSLGKKSEQNSDNLDQNSVLKIFLTHLVT